MKEWTSVDADLPIEGELVAVISSDEDDFCSLRAAVMKGDVWYVASIRDGMIYKADSFSEMGEKVMYWSDLGDDIPEELIGL